MIGKNVHIKINDLPFRWFSEQDEVSALWEKGRWREIQNTICITPISVSANYDCANKHKLINF